MPHGEHKIVGGENNSFEANEIYVKTSALTLLGQVIYLLSITWEYYPLGEVVKI